MGIDSNLIVDVEEYQACASEIRSACNGMDTAVSNLIQYLRTASSNGLQSGEAASQFLIFVNNISQLNGNLKEYGTTIHSEIENFLCEIDKADDLLFHNKGYKPFTDEEFDNAYIAAKNTIEPKLSTYSLNSFFSKILGKFMELIWKLADYDVKLGNDQAILRKKVKNLKDRSIIKLATIKDGVRTADRASHITMKNQLDVLKAYEQALRKIDAILAIESGPITAEQLSTLGITLTGYANLAKHPDVVTDDDVKYFADHVDNYFKASTDQAILLCDGSIGQLLVTDFAEYRATVDAAKDYFNSYSTDYKIPHEKYEKYEEQFQEILSLYNKYGSNWSEYFNGPPEQVAVFNNILEKADSVSEYFDDFTDVWFQFFCDMSESQEIFSRFKENCDLDDVQVQRALDRLEKLYKKDSEAYLQETFEKIILRLDMDSKKITAEAVAKACTEIMPVHTGVKKIINKFSSDLITQIFSEAPVVSQKAWLLATENSFNNAVEKLAAASPGSQGYDVLVQTVRETFDCAKQARIDFFDAMAKVSPEQTRQFCILNRDSAKSMSLEDIVPHSTVLYREFGGDNTNPLGLILDGNVSVDLN